VPLKAVSYLWCSKQTEIVLQTLKTNVCIFRLGEIYGPKRETEERVKKMAPGPFPGDGKMRVNISHIDDIIGGICFAMTNQLNGTFNLVSSEHPTRKDLYDKICKRHNLPLVRWDIATKSPHGGNRKVSSGKISKAGYQFQHLELDFIC